MKNLHGGSGGGRAIAALCLFLLIGTSALADGAVTAADGKANLLYIKGPQWPATSLRVFALEDGTKFRVSNQGSGSIYNRELPYHGAEIADNFHPIVLKDDGTRQGILSDVGYWLHDGTLVGVAQIPVTAGSATFDTELIFRDARGIMNVVDVDALPEPLAQTTLTERPTYTFAGSQALGDKSTFLAVIPERTAGAAGAELVISVRNERNVEIGLEYIYADSFVFYELQTPTRIGSLVITSLRARVGPSSPAARVWIVAFVGFREGGSPRVVRPTLSIDTLTQ